MNPYQHILFIDIETTSQFEFYEQLDAQWKKLWDHKSKFLIKDEKTIAKDIYDRAAIYAEFGKIICISCGYIKIEDGEKKLFIKSFYGHDEKVILDSFISLLIKWNANHAIKLCAHNGKEFDFPYLARRIIVNNLLVPDALQLSNKKPWEIPHIDTMEMWKFGDYKAYTSLNLLALTLGIPTPKDDIDGSMVHEVYYKEKNLERIVTYCQKDVATLVNVFLRINGASTIHTHQIYFK